MSDSPPVDPASSPPSEPAPRGVSRGVGVAISAVTALVVFAVGALMFPAQKAPAPTVAVAPPPPAPPPAPPPPPATPPVSSAGTVDAESGAAEAGAAADDKAPRIAVAEPEGREPGDGGAEPTGKKSKHRKDKDRDKPKDDQGTVTKVARGGGSESGASDKKDDNRPLPPSDGTAPLPETESSKTKEAVADCALPEKDMAREAWRRNWPTVCPIGSTGKSFILIPIKGSIEGETHELRRKPKREARVTLPAGSESQLTMKQYKVKKLGFKELWVSKDEGGAQLRVKLQPGAGDPVFEIKDGYAKITVADP